MAVIYLKHPVHGAKVATSDMEAENDMQNGWEEFEPTVSASVVVSEPVADPAPQPTNELRRRGRRPSNHAQG